MRARYRRSLVIAVAARPETLAARLAKRGRESPEAQRNRLERGDMAEVAMIPDRILDNDGALDEAVERLFEIVMSCRLDAHP